MDGQTDWLIDWGRNWLTNWQTDRPTNQLFRGNHFKWLCTVYFLFVTNCLLFTFLLLGPSVSPANVSFVSYNKTTFNISWAPLTRERSYGKVILYDVKEKLLSRGKRQKRSPGSSRTLNTTATFVVLYDLPLCSRYDVSVRAYTKAGPGPYTQPRVLETSSEYNHNVLVHIQSNLYLAVPY